jgi:alkylation response protein AidB-like acyl-CoA dehydrogenase
MGYKAPLKDIASALKAAGMGEIAQLPAFEAATADIVEGILAEAAKLAENVFDPLYRAGDLHPAKLVDGKVEVAPGWAEAWKALADGGWVGLAATPGHGGAGMPDVLGLAVGELFHSANMALALCSLLTQDAIYALSLYGSQEQQAKYLPKMIEGTWTGTMNLTEPQAGSDLGALRSSATPDGKYYRIKGQKIFISYGDHEMTENIIHLVLARLPDAPAGVKGISLFVVPKIFDGKLNDVHAASLEHKLGIHGSPTAMMIFGDKGGAIAELVGEPHRGLEYMFAMMNHARLDVGLQGMALASRATQQAVNFARERVQGKPIGFAGQDKASIVHHPDVRRLLISMKARVWAMRGLLYEVAAARDLVRANGDETALRKVELLTPVAKGWCTEVANQVVSDALQVHGGMGYVEETGIAQVFRDVRILSIYEGTTAIQANDLIGRKVLRDKGQALNEYLAQLASENDSVELKTARDVLQRTSEWIIQAAAYDLRLAYGAGVSFLHQLGLVSGAYALARQAKIGNVDADHMLQFYVSHHLPQVAALQVAITQGSEQIFALDEAAL